MNIQKLIETAKILVADNKRLLVRDWLDRLFNKLAYSTQE